MHQQRVGVIATRVLILMLGLGPVWSAVAVEAGKEGVEQVPESISPLVLRPVTAECHTPFTVPAATAYDNCAGDLTDRIVVDSPVDINTPGVYTVNYRVDDGNGNITEATREVTVADTRAPVIELTGRATVSVLRGHAYKDAGATAMDQCAGDLTPAIVMADSVSPSNVGSYSVTYDVNDGNGNSATQVLRTVNVVTSDVTPPDISAQVPDRSLAADAFCSARVPDLTGEVVATDDLTATVDLVIAQDPAVGTEMKGLGEHSVTLSVKDEAGNEAMCTAVIDLTVFDYSTSLPGAVSWTTNGMVNAMVAMKDTLYIAGEFTWAGVGGGSGEGWANLAKIDLATGEVLDWKPVVGGAVHALAVSVDGTMLYAGGDGFVDEVDVSTAATAELAATTGLVAALAASDGVLYMGGEFADSAASNYYLAAYDLAANVFLRWTAAVAGPVLSLAVSDTTLYVGGGNGIETVDIAAGGKGDVALLTVSNGPVDALAVSCETLYAGGGFTNIGGQAGGGIAALDLSGAAKSTWAPVADSGVHALALTGTGLYAAGEFTSVDSIAVPGIAQFTHASDAVAAPLTMLGTLAGEEVDGGAGECVLLGGRSRAAPSALPVSRRIRFGSDYG